MECPEPTGIVGEGACRMIERIKDHNGRDQTSHVFEYSIEKSHKNVNAIDFKLLKRIFIIRNENGKLPKHYGS